MSDETTVAPAPVQAPEPAPEPASEPRRGGPGNARRASGLLGQVVGIVGMVVCLALLVGVLVGRGWVTGAVTEVAGSLDAAVARTEPLVATAVAGVDAVARRAAETAAAAEAVAVDPGATPAALQAVVERLGEISERYLEMRSVYAGAREQIVSALDRLAVIDRFVPGLSVPQGPIDALAGLDERARALDAQVVELIDAGAAVQALNVTARTIAEKARAVESGLGAVTASLTQVGDRLGGLRTEIAGLADTVNTVVAVGSVVLALVLLYLALLHLVLFRSSRGHGRGPAA